MMNSCSRSSSHLLDVSILIEHRDAVKPRAKLIDTTGIWCSHQVLFVLRQCASRTHLISGFDVTHKRLRRNIETKRHCLCVLDA